MTRAETIAKGITLHPGDCLDVLAQLAEHSVDSCVTDPPYGLEFMGKEWDAPWQISSSSALFGKRQTKMPGWGVTRNPTCKECGGRLRGAKRCSCASPQWDEAPNATRLRQMTGFQDWCQSWAEQLFRVLKPGGHLIAFSGTRTYHRMAVAIEDAGFEIRDQIGWAYGSGFPKSHNIGDGWGTALKPAWEPVVVARKPLIGTVAENVREHGTGAINIDACRIHTEGSEAKAYTVTRFKPGATLNATGGNWRPEGDEAIKYEGMTKAGRWPANIVHDGSAEVIEAFPETSSGTLTPDMNIKPSSGWSGGSYADRVKNSFEANSGSAARFFYTAKADADDRVGSKHPTVKPVDLMQWLVRLVTPVGGVVLDPFSGTGTTGEAAFREGMQAILIEREAEYQEDIRRRMKLALAGPDERRRESIKARTKDEPQDHGPLFAESWDEMWQRPFIPEKR